jgi:hypothetical protein
VRDARKPKVVWRWFSKCPLSIAALVSEGWARVILRATGDAAISVIAAQPCLHRDHAGQKLVVLIGQRKALAMAVRNNKTQQRFTGLLARLIAPGKAIFMS